MAVRRRLAERISTVKQKSGLQTPILDEISLKAERLEALDFPLPIVEGVIPVIAKGIAYGATAGRWYRVAFPRPIYEPSVVCVGVARKGEIPEPKAPTISIPTVKLPDIPELTIPEITIPDIKIPHIPTKLGRFECGWAITSLTDGLNDLVQFLETVLVRINTIIDNIIEGFEKAKDTIRETHENLVAFKDDVRTAVRQQRDNTQAALNEYRDKIQSSVNDGLARIIPALYSAWGLPSNMAATPLHVRNVTAYSFEFQSLGETTAYWISVGSRR